MNRTDVASKSKVLCRLFGRPVGWATGPSRTSLRQRRTTDTFTNVDIQLLEPLALSTLASFLSSRVTAACSAGSNLERIHLAHSDNRRHPENTGNDTKDATGSHGASVAVAQFGVKEEQGKGLEKVGQQKAKANWPQAD
jgi:hypothetical protein